MKKPKILIVFCGGTIAMAKNQEGYLAPFLSAKELLAKFPEIKEVADTDCTELFNIDSTNMQPHHWTRIADTIYQNYESYTGFVVTHGTDTMVYSAAALSFALQNLSKPVVFTGAQKPTDEIASDARNNLINACKVAAMDLGEVSIVFGSQILRGNRTKKKSEVMLDAFWSPVTLPIGTISLEPVFINHYLCRAKKKLKYQPGFNPNVIMLDVTPGMNPKYLQNILEMGVGGLVLNAPGAGNIPHEENSLVPFIEKAYQKNIPVVVTTQCLEGSAQMHLYQAGVLGMRAGAISAGDMTHEAATAKLMWTLWQTKDFRKIKETMQKNISEEITVKKHES